MAAEDQAFKVTLEELNTLMQSKDRAFLDDLGGVEGLALRLLSDIKTGLPASELEQFQTRRAVYP
jgi:hypothetical protein